MILFFLAYQKAVSCIEYQYPRGVTYQSVNWVLGAVARDCSLHLILVSNHL